MAQGFGTMSTLIFEREAPAKVNLSLRILGKRADGFHEIESRMVRISVTDSLRSEALAPGSGLQFTCDDPSLPTDESNLVVKAVRGLEQTTGRRFDVSIHLTKRIPHGAGLGGGSSDAATTLLGLNEGLGLQLTRETLSGIAASLGSDIPFFLYECACDCRGRGEIVEPVPDFPWRPRLFLVKPAFSVPTPWAYREWQGSRELPGIDYGARPMTWGELVNSLERPVFAKHLVLADLKRFLGEQPGVAGALLSGSGSVVFAVLEASADPALVGSAVAAEFGETNWMQEAFVLP
jgi:4-diphosphocytidyl-2-C-methyl-D-erythritol kinase